MRRVTQREINFDRRGRGVQLDILRDCELPDVDGAGGRVKAFRLKAVLNAIDQFAREHGECFASQATLAQSVNFSRGQVKRAIAALLALNVVTCELKMSPLLGKVTNHHRIVWEELKRFVHKSDRERVHAPSVDDTDGAWREDRWRVARGPMARTRDTNRIEPNLTEPPPPSSIDAPDDPWREVEVVFCACGVTASASLVSIAKQRGLTAAESLEIARHFQEHQVDNGWSAGALFSRIRNAVPGETPAQRWVKGTRHGCIVFGSSSSREVLDNAKAAEKTHAAEMRELAELEARFGPELARASPEKIAELVRNAFPENLFMFQRFSRGGLKGSVREGVLRWLATPKI
jgi:hypothetical protein